MKSEMTPENKKELIFPFTKINTGLHKHRILKAIPGLGTATDMVSNASNIHL